MGGAQQVRTQAVTLDFPFRSPYPFPNQPKEGADQGELREGRWEAVGTTSPKPVPPNPPVHKQGEGWGEARPCLGGYTPEDQSKVAIGEETGVETRVATIVEA